MSSPSPSPKSAIREFLESLGLPPGLLSSSYLSYQHCHSRVWILDNSARMKARDSHVGRPGSEPYPTDSIERLDGFTRWDELRDCVSFHADMAARR